MNITVHLTNYRWKSFVTVIFTLFANVWMMTYVSSSVSIFGNYCNISED